MKALLINTHYNIGSTGKLTYNFRNYLKEKDIDVAVAFGVGRPSDIDKLFRTSTWVESKISNFFGRLTGLNNCFSFFSTNRLIKIVDEFEPDVIYCGNLHGHYLNIFRVYSYFKKKNIPIIQIMWDEFPMTGSCAFSYDCHKFETVCGKCPHNKEYPVSWFFDTSRILQKKKKKAYEYERLVFVSVPYIADRAKKAAVMIGKQIVELDEAVDQKNLYYPRNTNALRRELNIGEDKKIILNVCVYPGQSERKGGKYYLELARKCLDHPELVFIHVGFIGDTSECPSNYIPIGFEHDQNKMAEYYSLCDLFVCTSSADTQPNTCLEALSCGAGICGFNISGIPSCAEYPFGYYVDFPNTDQMKEYIVNYKKRTKESEEKTVKYAISRFSSDDYNRKLLDIYYEYLTRDKK